MGFFKKLFGTAAVTGAAVGGALYVKSVKKKENLMKVFLKILMTAEPLMYKKMTAAMVQPKSL